MSANGRTNGREPPSEEQLKTEIRDELDIQGEVLSSSESNPLLRNTNLGLGKYDDDYKWQQIRSYRKGLYAWVAFGRVLSDRQIYETKQKLGEEGFNPHYDEDESEVKVFPPFDEANGYWDEDEESRWTAVRRRGEEIWRSLGESDEILSQKQVVAINKKTGISDEWMPIFWELVSGRHEVSRSDEGELLRDLLTSVKDLRQAMDDDGGLLRR